MTSVAGARPSLVPKGVAAGGSESRFVNTDRLTVAVDEGVATVTLTNPPINAVSANLIDDLAHLLRALTACQDVQAVVLVGGIRSSFCAGGDLEALFGARMHRATERDRLELARRMQSAYRSIEECPKPVVAAINGVAVGAGLELALVCDVRVASERASFAMPELRHQIVPCLGGTQRLPMIVGLGRAKQILMLGERVRAEEALRWGLVHSLVAHDSVLETACRIARRLAAKPPAAFAALKRLLLRGTYGASAGVLDAESEAFWELLNARLRGGQGRVS